MKYVSSGGKEQPWYNADCRRAEHLKHQAYLAWADARARKDPDISTKKRNFNKAAKSFKLTLKRTRLNRISQIGDKLISYPSGSKAFWSLAKAVEANFCKTSLPPLLKPDGALAHSAREKADLFANLFANNSRLDDGNKVPPSLPHCGLSMPEFRITQKEVIKCLRSLDVNKASGPDGSYSPGWAAVRMSQLQSQFSPDPLNAIKFSAQLKPLKSVTAAPR
ncbi:unnamed protein product [Colias eurytheme]|nr:unnamed protein product [Colias eurytheme]